MKTSQRGIDLIKQFEGCELTAYRCIAGVPTIGFGSTEGVTATDVERKKTISLAEAERMLRSDLVKYERAVEKACTNPPTQSQFDALVCLAYNIGAVAVVKSSIIKAHNRGDEQSAARAFMLWNKARVNGQLREVKGLTRRRSAEAALYLEESSDAPRMIGLMPQAIEPEKPMSRSTIAGAATVISGASAIGGISEVTDVISQVSVAADTVSQAKDSATNMGDFLIPGLLILVACLGAYIIWERYQMRQRGAA